MPARFNRLRIIWKAGLRLTVASALLAPVISWADHPPNFVIIFADDLGYGDLGCFGSPNIETPFIDRMANEGMRFTSFYAQPICGPSRTALMTGCYPLRVAEAGNLKRQHPAVHPKEITLAEILKTKGYATGCFGKWDMAGHSQRGFLPNLMPNKQGFDYFFGTPSSNDSFIDLYRNAERIEEKSDLNLITDRLTEEVLEFIERHREQPFFVYLPHPMPHVKLGASSKFNGKSKRGLYGDVITEIDDSTGRIIAKLKELQLDQRTYIIFTSDNGPWLSYNKGVVDGSRPGDRGGSAGPLRSGKVTTWEGGIRVPTVVWAPGRVPAGKTCDRMASTLDLLPTFSKLAGAIPPKDRIIDGRNIDHLWEGNFEKADPEKVFFGYFGPQLETLRQGRWKLHLPTPEGWPIRNRHVAKVDDRIFRKSLLFDLETDLGETTDVAAQHPDVVNKLLGLAEAARNDIGDHSRVGKGARFFDPSPKRPNRKPPKRR